jgi:hypothetical protein
VIRLLPLSEPQSSLGPLHGTASGTGILDTLSFIYCAACSHSQPVSISSPRNNLYDLPWSLITFDGSLQFICWRLRARATMSPL